MRTLWAIGMAVLAIVYVCPVRAAMAADEPLILPVWPGKTPADSGIGAYGPIPEEHFRPPSDAPTKDAKWLTSVTKPTITVFRPSKEKNSGVAMVVCPGGGYWNLAWDLEGTEVAEWLANSGITGIVLKYRVPRRALEPEPLPAPGPVMDVQRAISLVRSKATEWGIDPNLIGIVGFSAGGHLALVSATQFADRAYERIDEVDRVSCRPDFAVAVYPGYLASTETGALAHWIRIPRRTPPILLIHASDDPEAKSEHSIAMYQALRRNGIPTELHIYATGGHGFGVRKTDKPCSTWTDRCIAWLQNLGMLTVKSR